MEHKFIHKLTQVIEDNIQNEQFGVSELAHEIGMSRSVLYRRIKLKTGKSISVFIREIRLLKALEKLQNNEGNVSEVASDVGFGSTTYFIKCFHDYFGYPPGDVSKKETNFTDPLDKRKSLKNFRIGKSLTISTVILLVIILAIIIFFIQKSDKRNIEKSIVVLPFKNDSLTDSTNYIFEGLREEIINKLYLIDEIKVISRTSSDTYRNSDKPIKAIAKELNVNYVLEGSTQTINDKTRIRLQLIKAKTDNHLWAEPFEREINDFNIFEIQQEIAELVIKRLKLKITPDDKTVISKKDTENKIAYSLYWQGMNYYNIYLKEKDYEPLLKSKTLFQKAIQYDSAYAKAIYQLSWVLFQESKFGETQIKRDSSLKLVNKAIELNPLFSEAYSLKGFLCQINHKEASKAFKMAIRTGPNRPEGYHQFGNYCCNIGEYANTIKYSLKSLEVNTEPLDYDWTFINLNVALSSNEFFELAAKYRNEYMIQYNNQMIYFNMQQFETVMKRKYLESIRYGLLAYQTDSTDLTTLDYLAQSYLFLRDFEKSLFYYQKYFESLKKQPYQIDFQTEYNFLFNNNKHSNSIGHDIFPLMHATYLYGLTQNKTIYNIHKKAMLDNLEKHIEYNTLWHQSNLCFFEMGCFYASINENEKTIENLKKLIKGKVNPVWLVNYLKDEPMLDGLKNDPEFLDILKKVEINYQNERKKVEKILLEKGMIEP